MKFFTSTLLAVGTCILAPLMVLPSAAEQPDPTRVGQHAVPSVLPGTTSNEIPELYAGESEEFGDQVILKDAPREKSPWFRATLDSEFSYMDNILLTHRNEDEDLLQVHTASMEFICPDLEEMANLRLSVFVTHQWFLFSDHTDFDFINQSAGIKASHEFAESWHVYGGYQALRSIDRKNENEFFKDNDFAIGVLKTCEIDDNNVLYKAFQVNYQNTSPASLSRVTESIILGWNSRFLEKFVNDLSFRYQHSGYYWAREDDDDRHDHTYVLSETLSYYFTPTISARVFANWTTNESNTRRAEYDLLAGGAGVSVGIEF